MATKTKDRAESETAPNQTEATKNDTPANAKQVSIDVLNATLADGIDLYNATRQAHWNVKGPKFHSLHELFQQFYEELQTGTDDVAERILALGGTAMGTSQVVAGSTRLPAYSTDLKAGEDHLKALIERYGQVANAMREGIEQTDEAGDAVTSDLLTEQVAMMDKRLWMLESFLQSDR